MDAKLKNNLVFDLRMALRKVPAAVWRDLGTRRLATDGNVCELIVADTVAQHLLGGDWEIRSRRPGPASSSAPRPPQGTSPPHGTVASALRLPSRPEAPVRREPRDRGTGRRGA